MAAPPLTLARLRHINEVMFSRPTHHRVSAHVALTSERTSERTRPWLCDMGVAALTLCVLRSAFIKEPSP